MLRDRFTSAETALFSAIGLAFVVTSKWLLTARWSSAKGLSDATLGFICLLSGAWIVMRASSRDGCGVSEL